MLPTPPLADAAAVLAPSFVAPLICILALGWLYLCRVRALARVGKPAPGWRQGCFAGGLAVMALAVSPPMDEVSDKLFLAHMAQHLLLGDIGALLLVLGLTGPLLAPILRLRFVGRLRVLAHPLVAMPVWALNFYMWHLPLLYQAALRHEALHALQHMTFVGFGIALWMPLFGPLPTPAWFGNLGRLGYIIVVRLTGTVLANVFLFSDSVFYPYYQHGHRLWGISPLGDQITAGAVMMVEESVLTIGLFCWLFLKSAREGEERQELLDLASARQVELSDRRAARAVAAGRGAELRRRLLTAESEDGEAAAGLDVAPPPGAAVSPPP